MGFGFGAAILGGAGLSAIGSIAGQLLGNKGNNDAIDAANSANIALWKMQSEYNTPANQVARLRAAGLNPNLFYSQGNPGNMTSAPTVQPRQYSYDFGKAIDAAMSYYQIKNLDVQNKNLEAQNRNLNATTRSIDLENELKVRDLELYRKYGLIPRGGLPQQVIKYGKDIADWFRSGDAVNWFMRSFLDSNYGKGPKIIDAKRER